MIHDRAEQERKQREAFQSFRSALNEESDRGCVLFAAAYLDHALMELLRSCLVQTKKIDEDLFKQNGPLASFSSRIKFAYYLGKISPSEKKDFETIRSIRNDFAHHPEFIDFSVQSIKDRCANLDHHWHDQGARARGKFTAAVSALLAYVHAATLHQIPATERPEQKISDDMKVFIRTEARRLANAAAEQPDEASPSKPEI